MRLTLCCSDERSRLKYMKVLCTLLILLLGVAAPLSLWADAVFPCTQLAQLPSRNIFIDVSAHSDMAVQNGHDSAQETFSHHGGTNNSESLDIDCECCVSCISLCASSAGTTSAIGSESLDSLLANQSQLIPAANTMHGNPDPISLFRPPKPNA